MTTKNKDTGIVYVLTNDSMPGLVKIGMTTRKDLSQRLNELYTTGVPQQFECAFACEVEAEKCKDLEKALHTAFDPQRVNPNREFFKIKPSQAIAILKCFDQMNVTSEVIQDLEKNTNEEEEVQANKINRRPPLNFFEMGIPQGAQLIYMHDSTKTCEVISSRKVRFEGQDTSLTHITHVLMNCKYAPQPTSHWQYNDRCLSEYYEDWQAKEVEENNEE